jgi:leucine efflux protein
VGAGYLVYLGLKMIFIKPHEALAIKMQPHHHFKQTFLMTLLNPPSLLFYMAFFPLFVDPTKHQGLLTFAVMAITVAVISVSHGFALTIVTQYAASHVHARPGLAAWLRKIAGTALVAFGLKLALSK